MPDNSSPFFPADNPAVTAHITLLQGIINRLANNSSACKTWCLALVAALLSFTGAMHNAKLAVLALLPVVIFGFVDAMYLAQEKAYRELYERVAMAVRSGSYQRVDAFEARAERRLRHICWALASWSVWPIYGGLLGIFLVAAWRGWFELLTAAATNP